MIRSYWKRACDYFLSCFNGSQPADPDGFHEIQSTPRQSPNSTFNISPTASRNDSTRPLLDPSPSTSASVSQEDLSRAGTQDSARTSGSGASSRQPSGQSNHPVDAGERPETDSQTKRPHSTASLWPSIPGGISHGRVGPATELPIEPVPTTPNGPPQKLREELCNVRIEWPQGGTRYFIPADDLARIFTVEAILKDLNRCQTQLPFGTDKQQLANHIINVAVRLFAVLVYLQQGHLISGFLNENISDEDLPFERSDRNAKSGKYKLCSKAHPRKPIECMINWDQDSIINFEREQWCVLAPIFEHGDEVPHYELGDNCVLPFIKDEERSDQAKEGGFSTVWEIVIHPAHQKLYKSTDPDIQNASIALKRLHSTREEEFRLEVEMLTAFTRRPHRNLVRLLCTYRHKNRYFLLFPYAKSNLRKYWEDNPKPEFSEATFFWSLYQCKSLASGLHMIHEYRTTQERALQRVRSGHGNLPGVEEDDRLYGRHGDIKPENILWSIEEPDEQQSYSEQGILLIADFGLMDFHKRLTRSQVLPDKISGSPTYEPPELKLRKNISRAYDIWSLGCVYLEFITWLVYGWEALDRFPKARDMTGVNGINDDTFYTIIDYRNISDSSGRAIVRKSVQDWIRDLRERAKCTAFIHEFLDLVSQDMLVVDHSKRIRCGPLNDKLLKMVERAKVDSDYLLKSAPLPSRPQKATPSSLAALDYTKEPAQINSPEDSPLPRRPTTAQPLHELSYSSPRIEPASSSILSGFSRPSSPI